VINRSSLTLFAVLAMAALPLAGCDSFNRALGKTRVIPDEFQVVSNTPLAIPPDYALRPPRVGNGTDQDAAAAEQARETVFHAGDSQGQGTLPPAQTARSAGENTLLRDTGADSAPTDIRKLVDTDPTAGVPLERSLVDKIVNWVPPKTPPSNEVIDAGDEATRLRLSQSVAKSNGAAPASAGDAGTPTFEPTKKSTSWFGWLF